MTSGNSVLFVLIGWAQRYDGTEAVSGGHKYLQDHAEDNDELQAFVRQDDGYFHCGVGKGKLHETSVDIVFVARHPHNQKYYVIAVYLSVAASMNPDRWCHVKASRVLLFKLGHRPECKNWPVGQGMRRWAKRVNSTGASHQKLLAVYRSVTSIRKAMSSQAVSTLDIELDAFEGEQRRLFVLHRKREARLRSAKLREVLRRENGRLRCEVSGCGFDFYEKYGEVGRNYAVVHHTKPLSSLSVKGAKTSLNDLVVVCANCHAMIHRGGNCRPIDTLLKKGS